MSIKTQILSSQKLNSQKLNTQILNNQELKTQKFNNDLSSRSIKKSCETKILTSHNETICSTRLFTKSVKLNSCNSTYTSNNAKNEKKIQDYSNTQNILKSYLDNKERDIFIKSIVNRGGFNHIYSVSPTKNHTKDNNLVIRISNEDTSSDLVQHELKGTKIQYFLCGLTENIGCVIDYGYIMKPQINKLSRVVNEYSINNKYGITLTKFLNSNKDKVIFKNLTPIVQFLKELLETIMIIHKNNYVHLDLKPCNILLSKNMKSTYNKAECSKIDFVIIDFGAAKQIDHDKSITIDEQTGSPAFSPPEMKNQKFGKKTDIWAYGIISYLMFLRKFYFDANAKDLFMDLTIDNIEDKLYSNLQNIWSDDKIFNNLSKNEFNKFSQPYSKNNQRLLIHFFKTIFRFHSSDRPNSKLLLDHPIFTYLS